MAAHRLNDVPPRASEPSRKSLAPQARAAGPSPISTPARYLSQLQHAVGNRAVGGLLKSPRRVIARVLNDDVPVEEFSTQLAAWKERVPEADQQWHAIAQGLKDKAELAAKQAKQISNPREFFLRKPEADRKSEAKALGLRPFEVLGWMRVATWAAAEGEQPLYLLVYNVRDADVQLEDIVKRPGDTRKLGHLAHDELFRRVRSLGRMTVTLLADQPWLVDTYSRYGYVTDEIQNEGLKTRMTKSKLMEELKT